MRPRTLEHAQFREPLLLMHNGGRGLAVPDTSMASDSDGLTPDPQRINVQYITADSEAKIIPR